MARGLVLAVLLVAMVMLTLPESSSAWFWGRSSRVHTVPPTASYDGNCNRPHGRDCTWYRRCLEKQIPCSGKTGDYAIAYGEKFCKKYTSSYSDFSQNGQKWLDAVRKCLQEKLAPELSRNPKRSCPDLKAYAFETHVPCYNNPGNGAPSFCSLSWGDRLEIISTIRSSFGSDFVATVVAGFKTFRNCL